MSLTLLNKNFFLIFVFMLFSESMEVAASQLHVENLKTRLENLQVEDENIFNAIVAKIKATKTAFSNTENTEVWFQAKVEAKKANKCLGFLLADKDQGLINRVNKIFMDYLDSPKMKELNNKDFKKMFSERKLRRKLMEFDDVPKVDSDRFCNFKISSKTSMEIKNKINQTNKKLTQKKNGKTKQLEGLGDYHPRDQKILKKLMEQKEKVGSSEPVFKTFLLVVMPSLESKAKLEFIPMVESKCPGITEKTWKKCEGKKGYINMLFKNVPKMYCLMDYKEEIGGHCF